MNEQQIERLARQLGERAAREVDVERTAAAVLHRLRTDPATRRPWWSKPAVLRVAASLVLLLGGALAIRAYVATGDGGPAEATPALVVSLDGLSESELTEMLDSMVTETPVYELVGAGLEDLNETQLEELLAQLDG